MRTILIVEDDQSLNKGVSLILEQPDFVFLHTYSIQEARTCLSEQSVDVIILDVNLPDGNGFEFCKEIRLTSKVPILFLTANDMETDMIMGFRSGGDDYVTKPFSLMILRERVLALLRRNTVEDNKEHYEKGRFCFAFEQMLFQKDGIEFALSKTEQKLLRVLVLNEDRTMTREMLLEKVWANDGEFIEENALNVTINRLRGKIEDESKQPVFIKTVYGLGYTWCASGKNK